VVFSRANADFKYCLLVIQNKKDKGVVNGMVISKLGMGLTWIHDFRKACENVSIR
jgi:hypothetical protein